MNKNSKPKLRRQSWWDYRAHPDMTAFYLERFLNYVLRAKSYNPAGSRNENHCSMKMSVLALISIKKRLSLESLKSVAERRTR
jgi:hypothetical protein